MTQSWVIQLSPPARDVLPGSCDPSRSLSPPRKRGGIQRSSAPTAYELPAKGSNRLRCYAPPANAAACRKSPAYVRPLTAMSPSAAPDTAVTRPAEFARWVLASRRVLGGVFRIHTTIRIANIFRYLLLPGMTGGDRMGQTRRKLPTGAAGARLGLVLASRTGPGAGPGPGQAFGEPRGGQRGQASGRQREADMGAPRRGPALGGRDAGARTAQRSTSASTRVRR
jgi:hypothetical protein